MELISVFYFSGVTYPPALSKAQVTIKAEKSLSFDFLLRIPQWEISNSITKWNVNDTWRSWIIYRKRKTNVRINVGRMIASDCRQKCEYVQSCYARLPRSYTIVSAIRSHFLDSSEAFHVLVPLQFFSRFRKFSVWVSHFFRSADIKADKSQRNKRESFAKHGMFSCCGVQWARRYFLSCVVYVRLNPLSLT